MENNGPNDAHVKQRPLSARSRIHHGRKPTWPTSFSPMAALKVGAIFSPQCENNTKCGSSHWRSRLPNTSPPGGKRNLYAAGNLRLKTTRTNYKDALNLLWRTTCEDTLRAEAMRDTLLIPQTWQDLRSGVQR